MKGKLYKPNSSCENFAKIQIPQPKPWRRQKPEALVYMWKSSIPNSILKSKKKPLIQHVSEAHQHKSTLDFLQTNQKYISFISDTHNRTPSESSRNSRIPSPTSFNESKSITEAKIPNEPTSINEPQNISESIKQTLIKSPSVLISSQNIEKIQVKCAMPKSGKRLQVSASLKTFEFGTTESQPVKYLVNRYSLPKVLIAMKKQSESKPEFKNQKVNEFISRFQRKVNSISIAANRNAPNGWKLVGVHKYLN